MSVFADGLCAAADTFDRDDASTEELCVAVAACQEAAALMLAELRRRSQGRQSRVQRSTLAILRAKQSFLQRAAGELPKDE